MRQSILTPPFDPAPAGFVASSLIALSKKSGAATFRDQLQGRNDGDARTLTFAETAVGASNNLDLPRDGIALLVVLWSLIILPKRELQVTRSTQEGIDQGDMFGQHKPLPTARSAGPVVNYKALLADFGVQLGKKTRLDTNLRQLERHGFIERRGDDIGEGPLLDLLLDYDALAPRILDGALGEVLKQRRAQADAQAEGQADARAEVQASGDADVAKD
nr:hypothetical protein [Variovorax sp. WDL1]